MACSNRAVLVLSLLRNTQLMHAQTASFQTSHVSKSNFDLNEQQFPAK